MTNARTNIANGVGISLASLACLLAATACSPEDPPSQDRILISLIGTNDVHGVFSPEPDRGGLVTISGYVDAVRAARSEDGGAVLLIDAGDMWQGMLESNLAEGATVVEAYNAMEYTAAAIGNHEFDFGPLGEAATPQNEGDDPRGNLKQRASEMDFPLLNANLIDQSTGKLVDWNNVSPSVLIDVQGIKVGIIGVITTRALITTIPSNVVGLEVEPLAESVTREATALRGNGAQMIIVSAHAGSECTEFLDPYDLSSCNMDGEIMRVANALPQGLVDHIVAGHTHDRVAHIVNGISITSGIARTISFSRTDFELDRKTGEIIDRKVFPPQYPCPWISNTDGACAWDDAGDVSRAIYEGRPVNPRASVLEVAERAHALAADVQNEKLGPYLETPFTLDGNPESALGNLFVDAVLWGSEGDIAIHNVTGGIRAELSAGDLTYGDVYEVFPFDNVTVVLDIAGRDLRRIIAKQAHNHPRRAGIAGMRVVVKCANNVMDVDMTLDDGRSIADEDVIKVIANDFLALEGDDILTPATPEGGYVFDNSLPRTRDILIRWFRAADDRLNQAQFLSTDAPRWTLPADLPQSCQLPEPG